MARRTVVYGSLGSGGAQLHAATGGASCQDTTAAAAARCDPRTRHVLRWAGEAGEDSIVLCNTALFRPSPARLISQDCGPFDCHNT